MANRRDYKKRYLYHYVWKWYSEREDWWTFAKFLIVDNEVRNRTCQILCFWWQSSKRTLASFSIADDEVRTLAKFSVFDDEVRTLAQFSVFDDEVRTLAQFSVFDDEVISPL